MKDIQTGNNDVSIAVIGGVFYVPPGWNLSLGARLPTPRSHTRYGLVLEWTFGAPKE
jgi:hypothetical protein